jgi:putative transposase
MPYWKLFYHFVWSTRAREPLIPADREDEMYSVIVAKAREFGATVHAIGGTDNHIHLAVSIPPPVALSEFIGQVKGNSSHWVNHVLTLPYQFAWQGDYGVVSFGAKQLDVVAQYIKDQRRHHQQNTAIQFLERMEPEASP